MRNSFLRNLLKAKNITTIELSKKMDISTATLNKKIKGDIKFSEKDIKTLLEVLNMTYEEVFQNKCHVVMLDDKYFIVSSLTATKIKDTIIKEVV